MWINKKWNKNNLEIIKFLKLLHSLRGVTAHSLKIDISKKEELKKIVIFCKKKQSINTYQFHEIFKAILKTSEILLEKEFLKIL